MIMASILAYVLGCIWYLICLFVFKKRFNNISFFFIRQIFTNFFINYIYIPINNIKKFNHIKNSKNTFSSIIHCNWIKNCWNSF